MYNDGQGHIETSGGTIYIGYNNSAPAYVGGSLNAADIYSRGNLNCASNHYMGGNYLFLPVKPGRSTPEVDRLSMATLPGLSCIAAAATPGSSFRRPVATPFFKSMATA